MLKVAVIGCGSMGQNHIRNYADIDEVELVGVCDVDLERAKSFAKKYGCRAYGNYLEMIEKENPEIISVVVPTKLHKKVAVDVLNKGVNVLLEKPIAPTIKEAEEIIKAAEKNRVKLMIGHIERFNPAVLEAKQRILKNEIGKIIEIVAVRVGPFPPRIRDVGVITDLTIHDIDTVRFLTNSEIKEVYGSTASKINSDRADLFFGIAKFKDNALALFQTNWITPTKIRETKIVGEHGMFKIDYLTQDLYFYENAYFNSTIPTYDEVLRGVLEGRMIKYKINKKEPLRNEIMHFINCVKHNKEPAVSGEVGLENLKIALKFIESSKKKKVVELK